MTRKISLVFLVSILILTQCGPEVKYKNPQPEGKHNLDAIPDVFLGNYLSREDSTNLIVDKKGVFKVWKSNEMMQLDSIIKDLKFKVQNDTVIHLNDGFMVEVKFTGEPSKVLVSATEKLFQVSDSGIVRKYKGYCFLNYKTKNNYWLVKTLRIKGDYLEFSDLIDPKEIDDFRDATKIIAIKDSSSNNIQEYQLDPSLRETRRILRNKGFNKEYKKIK